MKIEKKIKKAKEQMKAVIRKMERLNCLIGFLANYFCEDEKTFKVEESFKILAAFLCRLRDSIKVGSIIYHLTPHLSFIICRLSVN